MKIRFNRLISVICAIMILISTASVWAFADEMPATPTDLTPAEEENIPEEPAEEQQTEPETEPEQVPEEEPVEEPEDEPEEDPAEETVESVEVIVTKTLTMGQSWEGKMKKTKPAVLKLDLNRSCTVYMLVEGRDVWATVEKSDRPEEDPTRTQTDPNTGWKVITWPAEEGSYLITLGPVEPNLLAAAKVTFMDRKAYDAWEAEQAAAEHEPEEEAETESNVDENELRQESEEETEKDPNQTEELDETDGQCNSIEQATAIDSDELVEEEQIQTIESEVEEGAEELEESEGTDEETEETFERSIDVELTWDTNEPHWGDTAHLRAVLTGYEGLEYSFQWQTSQDLEHWDDVLGETKEELDVVITRNNNNVYWRVVVYVEEPES